MENGFSDLAKKLKESVNDLIRRKIEAVKCPVCQQSAIVVFNEDKVNIKCCHNELAALLREVKI